MTHVTSCRNVISIEHTSSTVFDGFWTVLLLEKESILYSLVKHIPLYCTYKFQNKKNTFYSKCQPWVNSSNIFKISFHFWMKVRTYLSIKVFITSFSSLLRSLVKDFNYNKRWIDNKNLSGALWIGPTYKS